MAGYVEVTLLDGGSFIADSTKIHAGVENYQFRLYNWAFYIHHPSSRRKVLWDAGMSNSKADYSTFVVDHIYDAVQMTGPRIPLQEQILAENGVEAEQLDAIIFSHAHFDHCRPMSGIFSKATAYFGPGTRLGCLPGHFKDPSCQWDGRFFDPDSATEKWHELPGPWQRFAAFDKAMDFFNDGSFWVIQAPGHMKGNLCAVAKLQNGEYVVLGSDCCHSKELYDGVFDFAIFDLPKGGKGCLQEDIPAAKDTLARIKVMEKEHGAHVAFAHDTSWITEAKDEVLLSLLPKWMRHNAREKIEKGESL